MGSPLEDLRFLSVRQLEPRLIGESQDQPGVMLDPAIPLPVLLPPARPERSGACAPPAEALSVTWEAIVAGMLTLLAHQPRAEHAGYYRRFVLAVRPDIKQEFTEAGVLKIRRGEPELAVEVFRALAGLFPDCPATWNNLALACEQLGRQAASRGDEQAAETHTAMAFEAYKRAVAIDPGLAGTHFNFAHFYLRQGNSAKAREHLERFLTLDPAADKADAAKALLRELDGVGSLQEVCARAFDAVTLGRESEAVGLLEEYTARFPETWNPWFLLGWAYRRLGRYEEGRRALERARSLGPPHADTLNELAICLMETGDYLGSRDRLSEAVALEPENLKLTCNLGVLALRMGRTDEARRHFEAVLAVDPEDPPAREYLRRLSS